MQRAVESSAPPARSPDPRDAGTHGSAAGASPADAGAAPAAPGPAVTPVDGERDWQRLVLFVVALAFLLVTAGVVSAQPSQEIQPSPEMEYPRAVPVAPATGELMQRAGTQPAPGGTGGPAPAADGAIAASGGAVAGEPLAAIGGGHLLLLDEVRNGLLAPWVDTHVDVTISGVVARVTVRQGFLNVTDRWVAGEYTFPLPGNAAVRAMRLRVDGREIVGRIEAREQARRTYEEAKAAGRRAGLVERNRADVFAVAVANIPPGERIDVVLEYVQPLEFDSSGFEFRFPMTIMPRYEPQRVPDEAKAAAREVLRPTLRHAVLEPSEDYRALASVAVRLDADVDPAAVASPSHQIERVTRPGGVDVAFPDQKVPMDRDFVLRWMPQAGEMPDVAVYTEELDGETYALAVMVPPSVLPPVSLPREMILVVDVSGSMQGQSIRQAKRAAAYALDALRPQDRINVIAFNQQPRALFPFPVPADHHALRKAHDFLRALRADGGTEMHAALAEAFAPRAPLDHVRQVVFVTDGAVGNQASLIELIRRQRGEARLFPVGIGAAPATHLMQRMADAGRGSYTHVASAQEVAERMGALFARLEHPVLTQIRVQWPGGGEAWPQDVPDLYAGEPLMLTAKLPRAGGELRVSGLLGRDPWSLSVPMGQHETAPGVGIVWAQRKVAALTSGEMTHLGGDDVAAAVTRIGLTHSLATRYTSFVAVERQPARPMLASVEDTRVPALLPAGGRRVAYPATATPAAVQLSLASVAVLFGALLWSLGSGHRRPRPAAGAARETP